MYKISIRKKDYFNQLLPATGSLTLRTTVIRSPREEVVRS